MGQSPATVRLWKNLTLFVAARGTRKASRVLNAVLLTMVFLVALTALFFLSQGYAAVVARPSSSSHWELLERRPHDPTCFTQGLEFLSDTALLETCGIYGRSSIRLLQFVPKKGGGPPRLDRDSALKAHQFGEGMTVDPSTGRIYVLTWKEHELLVYDKGLNLVAEIRYPYHGWGLAYDKAHQRFYATDGTETLHHFDIVDTTKVRSLKDVKVKMPDGKPVKLLNELEVHGKYGYANQWYAPYVYRFDPFTGVVSAVYDLSQLQDEKGDTLNGIAKTHGDDDTFWVTGKLYRTMYRVRLT